MPNYKQLCIELINELNGYKVAHPQHDTELIDRARAALAEPEPEVPTDEELLHVFDTACLSEGGMVDEIHLRGLRAVLARWGNHPGFPDSSTPQPIPVAERLPKAEDCDAEGMCWLTTTETEPGWVLDYPDRCTNYTHWLPAHALPLLQ